MNVEMNVMTLQRYIVVLDLVTKNSTFLVCDAELTTKQFLTVLVINNIIRNTCK